MMNPKNYFQVILILAVFASLGSGLFLTDASAQTKNGFDLSNSTIPIEQILSGGPPRDGIPSIDDPKFLAAKEIDYLKESDIVIGVVQKDRARAYPLRVLVWHEVVNDSFDGKPIAVTYCPLCGTAMVFDRKVDGKLSSFGVSGMLFQSDVLLYDRESESLWSQVAMEAVSGPHVGKKLRWLPSKQMTWGAWKAAYPNSHVLSKETGHQRDYAADAYSKYFQSEKVMFPVNENRRELGQKEWVIGILVNGTAKAYPVNQLPSKEKIEDLVGGQKVAFVYDADSRYPHFELDDGSEIPSVTAFWFAWQAFYPKTDLWSPEVRK